MTASRAARRNAICFGTGTLVGVSTHARLGAHEPLSVLAQAATVPIEACGQPVLCQAVRLTQLSRMLHPVAASGCSVAQPGATPPAPGRQSETPVLGEESAEVLRIVANPVPGS